MKNVANNDHYFCLGKKRPISQNRLSNEETKDQSEMTEDNHKDYSKQDGTAPDPQYEFDLTDVLD